MFDFTLKDDSENTLQKCGIYKITCTVNDKIYVGCTYRSFRDRFLQHRSTLKRGTHYAFYMQNCYNKYGSDAFQIEILEIIPKDSQDLIFEREDYWIDLLQPHFNYPLNANNGVHIKTKDATEACNKIHSKSKTGHRGIHITKDGKFGVQIGGYHVGKFWTLEDATQAKEQFLLNPVYREPKPPAKSGEKYIKYHKDGWTVKINGKYVGFYVHLNDAILVRDAFLKLPLDEQVAKICSSNTGHRNIQYREKTKRYRVVFAGDEVASSCKTLEEAIAVRDKFLDTGERPPNQKAGCGHKYIQRKGDGFVFIYKYQYLGAYKTLEEAVAAKDEYFKTQNKLVS